MTVIHADEHVTSITRAVDLEAAFGKALATMGDFANPSFSTPKGHMPTLNREAVHRHTHLSPNFHCPPAESLRKEGI